MSEAEAGNWLSTAIAALGISGSGLGAWVLSISSKSATQDVRLAKLEDDMDDQNANGHQAHEVRINRLELDHQTTQKVIAKTADTIARLDERTIRTGEEVTNILSLLREKG